MLSNSTDQIKRALNKNLTPKNTLKKIKIKKSLLRKLSPIKPLKENLPIIQKSLTPRERLNEKKLMFKKKSQMKSVENYLISTSLLSKYDNINTFDFSYFKKLSNKYSPLISKKEITSGQLTDGAEKALKKNLIINLLKKRREEISKDEKLIQYSYREYKRKIDEDFFKFTKISNEYNAMKRKEERILAYYKLVSQKAKYTYYTEKANNKKLRDIIEKTIRDIYKLKEYAVFIHSMYGLAFPMEKINDELLYENKFDTLKEELINLYTDELLEKENEKKERLLKDINLFMKNFIFYENNIIQLLKEENIIIKDIYYMKIDNKKRLQHLVRRKENYLEDKDSYNKIHNNYLNQILSSSGKTENELYNESINYIIQFTKIFDIPTSLDKNNDKEIEYYKYCKDILNVLKEKESFIDECTNKIEEILNSENEQDKKLMEKAIFERKRYNLRKMQFFSKENMLKKIELSKKKIIDKNKKKVVKGRLILDYKFISLNSEKQRKKEELKENMKKNNDINLEYCFSEYKKIK